MTLRGYLGVIKRRAIIIALVAFGVQGLLIAMTLGSTDRYAASAGVLLRKGSQVQGGAPAALRAAKTQADLAGVPAVAERALHAAKVSGRTPQDLLKNS